MPTDREIAELVEALRTGTITQTEPVTQPRNRYNAYGYLREYPQIARRVDYTEPFRYTDNLAVTESLERRTETMRFNRINELTNTTRCKIVGDNTSYMAHTFFNKQVNDCDPDDTRMCGVVPKDSIIVDTLKTGSAEFTLAYSESKDVYVVYRNVFDDEDMFAFFTYKMFKVEDIDMTINSLCLKSILKPFFYVNITKPKLLCAAGEDKTWLLIDKDSIYAYGDFVPENYTQGTQVSYEIRRLSDDTGVDKEVCKHYKANYYTLTSDGILVRNSVLHISLYNKDNILNELCLEYLSDDINQSYIEGIAKNESTGTWYIKLDHNYQNDVIKLKECEVENIYKRKRTGYGEGSILKFMRSDFSCLIPTELNEEFALLKEANSVSDLTFVPLSTYEDLFVVNIFRSLGV